LIPVLAERPTGLADAFGEDAERAAGIRDFSSTAPWCAAGRGRGRFR